MTKSIPEYALVVRRSDPAKSPRGPFVTVWLSKKVSWGWAALVSGDVAANAFDELAAALGLPVIDNTGPSPLAQETPNDKPDCLPVSEQKELFP
jgi:hypothetical protein